MRPLRRLRFRIVLVVMACLLSQQVALAAYACTLERAPSRSMTMVEHCASQAAGEAQDSPALCQNHCAPDQVVTDGQASLSVPALLLPPVRFAAAPAIGTAGLQALQDAALARSDPPPRLRYCTLLI